MMASETEIYALIGLVAIGLLAAVVAIMVNRIKTAQSALNFEIERTVRTSKENRYLRDIFANLTGWTDEGTLPADAEDLIRERFATPPADHTGEDEAVASPLRVAAAVLREGGAPLVAAHPGLDEVRLQRNHQQLVEFMDHLAASPEELATSLARSELEYLFRMTMRLDAYYQFSVSSYTYALAAATVMSVAALEGNHIKLVRPLTLVEKQEANPADNDTENLKTVDKIVQKVEFVSARLSDPVRLRDCALVVDCVAHGWTSDKSGSRNPVVLEFDRTWISR